MEDKNVLKPNRKLSRYNRTRIALLFWCLFIGIGAVWGASAMLLDPSGRLLQMDKMLPYFQVLPFANVLFQNYIFSGISLFIVNGISNLIAAYFLIKKRKIGSTLGMTFGITLMLWIDIQFIIFPSNILSNSFFIFGLVQAITGYMNLVFYTQEHFKINEENYKNIGKKHDQLVVYFSRMGYTKKVALEEANKIGADILEISAKDNLNGTLGFLWSGRYGMHRWGMPIEKVNIKIEDYKNIIICTPIWVGDVASPIREFCLEYSGKIKNVEYILIHFNNLKFKYVADELDQILKTKRTQLTTICSQFGSVRYSKVLK